MSSVRSIADHVLAWTALLAVDVLMKVRGFASLHRLVKRWPVRPTAAGATVADARACCATIDRAAAFYFKRAWCLQRSAVTVMLLRRRGIPAQFTIGAHAMPFLAHAWVELDGRVINDDEAMIRARFAPLERC